MPKSVTELKASIVNKSATVGVIGLGYVGLPLIRAFVQAGFRTMGFDVDQTKVDRLLAGQSYIGHIPSEWIAECIATKRFTPTADMRRLAEADALLICVPTPLTESRDPDLSYVESTARHIAAALRPGQLIVLESTTYPGTTRDVVLPILAAGGLKAGQRFLSGLQPRTRRSRQSKLLGRRHSESRRRHRTEQRRAGRGAVQPGGRESGAGFELRSRRSVQDSGKHLPLGEHRHGQRAEDALRPAWASTSGKSSTPPRPSRSAIQAFYPGPGLGGHCIPIDPFYLSWVARKHGMSTRFIELAGEINTSMPLYVIHRLAEALNDAGKPVRGSKISLLGVAYKKDVDDPRESPSFELLEMLLRARRECDLQRSARSQAAADAAPCHAGNDQPAADQPSILPRKIAC